MEIIKITWSLILLDNAIWPICVALFVNGIKLLRFKDIFVFNQHHVMEKKQFYLKTSGDKAQIKM